MIKNRYTTIFCSIITAAAVIITVLFLCGDSWGLEVYQTGVGYENRLFDDTRVHTLDIIIDESEWQSLMDNPLAKEYVLCSVIIDQESFQNIAIRTKGNTSLTSVASSDSDRYSFKIEFDHYDSSKTYHGLDKLALNNIYQDSTYLKDYLSYHWMNEIGVAAPLTSFVNVSINGETFGLYLAVEGIEEGFAQRNYGSDYGKLYKPDSMQMNGGNGKQGSFSPPEMPEGQEMPDFSFPEGKDRDFQPPEGWEQEGGGGPENDSSGFEKGGGMPGFGSMGNSDVALQYSDDEYDSYSNIFDGAVFDITNQDKDRLIAAIKRLNEGTDLENTVDIEQVLKYFVVHNFVVNFDSYTGNMMHNYYLYEKDGILSMVPWDYNLAFGGFSGGGGGRGSGGDGATSSVNYPIDTPVSGTTLEDRPMLGQLLSNDTYMKMYHQYFEEFLSAVFDNDAFVELIDQTVALISPYVQADPTAFCSYEEFETGVETLKEFCLLRAESVRGQLDGSIPSTTEGQAADSSSLIDASNINISDMGSMGMGGGFGGGHGMRGGSQEEDQKTRTVPTEEEPADNGNTGKSKQADFPFQERAPVNTNNSSGNWIALGISAAVLCIGIIFAKVWR